MKKLIVSLAALIVLALPTSAYADTITFWSPVTAANNNSATNSPSSSNYQGGTQQFDLDHHRAYTWSIRHNFAPGQTITAAKLTFRNMANWDTNQNRLFVNMLDFARNTTHNAFGSVVDATNDPTAGNGGFNDYFDTAGNYLADGADKVDLTTLVNLSTSPNTIVFNFTAAQLVRLNEFFSVADNTLAFGFDPDCHFWNNGISFEITTTTPNAVPEPTTMALLGTGLASLYYRRRRQQRGEATQS